MRKKYKKLYGEDEDKKVSYNSPPQEPFFSEFQDHNVGLLVFYLPPHRQLTLCL